MLVREDKAGHDVRSDANWAALLALLDAPETTRVRGLESDEKLAGGTRQGSPALFQFRSGASPKGGSSDMVSARQPPFVRDDRITKEVLVTACCKKQCVQAIACTAPVPPRAPTSASCARC